MINGSESFAVKMGLVKRQAVKRVMRWWSPVLGVLTAAGVGLWWARRWWVDAVCRDASRRLPRCELYDTILAVGLYTMMDDLRGLFYSYSRPNIFIGYIEFYF